MNALHYGLAALAAAGTLSVVLLWTFVGEEHESVRLERAGMRPLAVATRVSTTAQHAASESRPNAKGRPRQSPTRPATWQALDEDEILRSLGELSADDAELSLQLVREARARFADSPRAVERDYFEVRALVNLGKLDEAVAKARVLVAAHPHDPFANEVARHLLTHPLTHPTEIGRR